MCITCYSPVRDGFTHSPSIEHCPRLATLRRRNGETSCAPFPYYSERKKHSRSLLTASAESQLDSPVNHHRVDPQMGECIHRINISLPISPGMPLATIKLSQPTSPFNRTLSLADSIAAVGGGGSALPCWERRSFSASGGVVHAWVLIEPFSTDVLQ